MSGGNETGERRVGRRGRWDPGASRREVTGTEPRMERKGARAGPTESLIWGGAEARPAGGAVGWAAGPCGGMVSGPLAGAGAGDSF